MLSMLISKLKKTAESQDKLLSKLIGAALSEK